MSKDFSLITTDTPLVLASSNTQDTQVSMFAKLVKHDEDEEQYVFLLTGLYAVQFAGAEMELSGKTVSSFNGDPTITVSYREIKRISKLGNHVFVDLR
jgi:5-deoxy-D-glucuronate isomerase